MDIDEIRQRFTPAIQEIVDTCRLTDEFVDKEMFRVYIATIWGNAVLDPGESGVTEDDLSVLHDFLNEEIEDILGTGETITSCYEYIVSKAGDESLSRLRVTARHREFLHYFARLVIASAG
ncbi:MAG TPA: hypothetical protein VJ998_10480 [Pseudomonadales bacterium]|nr:hypothetical protein [Pseudomonadales bacterium]